MFTGIVQEVGVLKERSQAGPSVRFHIRAPRIAPGLKVGDSVACNGVCLTAESVSPEGFAATAVPETLSRTVIGNLRQGDGINLEPALSAGAPLGGHFMQGHVDGVAEVVEVKVLSAGGGKELTVRIPGAFTRYCVEKGSFGLHGASLTIARLEGALLTFALVPHTLANTTLDGVTSGHRLNFEVDMLGKYVEKLLRERETSRPGTSPIDQGRLESWGYGV